MLDVRKGYEFYGRELKAADMSVGVLRLRAQAAASVTRWGEAVAARTKAQNGFCPAQDSRPGTWSGWTALGTV